MRHRQRAQITPFALFAALIMLGAVALVVDAGVFFITKRQLQNAADAAALAAVWYDDICTTPFPTILDHSSDPVGNRCDSYAGPQCPNNGPGRAADCVAGLFLQQNMGYVGKLCARVTPTYDRATARPGWGLRYYLIDIDCDAPYWFARVFPRIPATMSIKAHAIATVGFRTQSGEASGTPVCPETWCPPTGTPLLVARLSA